MFVALGDLHDRVKIRHHLLQPLAGAAGAAGVGAGRPGVDFAAHQSRVELGASSGGDEFSALQAELISEQPTFIVVNKAHRLSADP